MDPYLGEIRLFAGNYPPKGWAFCNGQLLSIAQNTALFSLLGTTYGGDGKSTFKLPDLQGRVPLHQGAGPGLTQRNLGEIGGQSTVTLTQTQMPEHNHVPQCKVGRSHATNEKIPNNAIWGSRSRLFNNEVSSNEMLPTTVAPTGQGVPHNNMQPCLGLNFIIALQGIFPSRP